MKRSGLHPKRRTAAVVLLALLAFTGCKAERSPELADVLRPAEGQIANETGQAENLDAVLASARGRPVSVSFAYVGCGGGRPRMDRLREAARSLPDPDDVLHLVFNIVDEPSRYPDLVRDLAGAGTTTLDPNKVRVAFLRKPDLFPKTNGAAVDGIMQAMGLRFGSETHIETVTGIGIFDAEGRFVGIRY